MNSRDERSTSDDEPVEPFPEIDFEAVHKFLMDQETPLSESRPELAFAIVRTLGTDASKPIKQLEDSLISAGYRPAVIKLSSLLKSPTDPGSQAERYTALMNAGDIARKAMLRSDAVMIRGIAEFASHRTLGDGSLAFIIHTLVHPDEVRTLRAVFGSRLFVIVCDQPRWQRVEVMKARFIRHSGLTEDEAEKNAVHAINRDAGVAKLDSGAVKPKYRVQVAETAQLGDVFIRGDEQDLARFTLNRLVECILGHPFHTPTLDEIGMAAAFHASLATATLSRRVGAAVMLDGQIIAIGANEVPKTGGGIYHAESIPDGREWQTGGSASDLARSQILGDLLGRLKDNKWFDDTRSDKSTESLVREALGTPELAKSEIFDVVEYDRATHAEMVAITGAARLGTPLRDATLYTTTLPCHECTRNVIATGFARVVYLLPYEKSKGAAYHADSMSMISRHGVRPGRISFEPFTGFSYQRFSELFSWLPRKEDDVRKSHGETLIFDGAPVSWRASEAPIRKGIFDPLFSRFEQTIQRLREKSLISLLHDSDKDEESTQDEAATTFAATARE